MTIYLHPNWLTRRLLKAANRLDTEVPDKKNSDHVKTLVLHHLSKSLDCPGKNPRKDEARSCYTSLLIARRSLMGQNTVESMLKLSILEEALSLEKTH